MRHVLRLGTQVSCILEQGGMLMGTTQEIHLVSPFKGCHCFVPMEAQKLAGRVASTVLGSLLGATQQRGRNALVPSQGRQFEKNHAV